MTNWEAKMLEKFSESVENAIATYLADKNMSIEAICEYFSDVTIVEKITNYIEVIR